MSRAKLSTERANSTGWLVIATFAGIAVLAFADVPQSLDMVFLTGPDSPEFIGPQLTVALAGAVATGAAVLVARFWRWLLPASSLGLLIVHLVHTTPGCRV